MSIDWGRLRDEEFPVAKQWVFLDHAAVAPLPKRSADTIIAWTEDSRDNGVVHWPAWARKLDETRGRLARLINAHRDEIALAVNTTQGIGFIAEGFPFQPGDNVVTAAEEYPSNIYPWMNLASRGVELRRVPTRPDARIWIDDLAAAIDDRTKLLTISHVEFASGFRNDLDRIGELCRDRGVAFFVDAIQGLGPHRIDVSRTPIDFLAADGHKWLLGPEGAGFFYVRREWIDRLRPIMIGWHSVAHSPDHSRIEFNLKPNAQRWEGGSFPMAGLQGFGASLELIMELGPEAVSERILDRADRAREVAEAAGWTVYGSSDPQDRSAIVSLIRPDTDYAAAVREFRQRQIVVSLRGGRLRVSPHIYNDDEDLDRLSSALKAV